MTKLEQIIIDMKDNPRPSPDWDVLYEERGEDEWSGLEYSATDSEYEDFQDNIYSWGMGSQEILKDEIEIQKQEETEKQILNEELTKFEEEQKKQKNENDEDKKKQNKNDEDKRIDALAFFSFFFCILILILLLANS